MPDIDADDAHAATIIDITMPFRDDIFAMLIRALFYARLCCQMMLMLLMPML